MSEDRARRVLATLIQAGDIAAEEPDLRDLAWAELCAERDRYRDRCRAAEADLLALLGGVPSMIAPGEWRRWEALRDGLLWKGGRDA